MVAVLHGAGGTSAGDGAQGGDVAEHLREGHLGLDDAGAAAGLVHALHLSATLVQVADDVAHVLLGRHHLELHDGLHEHGLGLGAAVLVGYLRCYLERQLVGVYGVERAVKQLHLQRVHGVSAEDAVLHGALEALLHRGYELLGHAATGDAAHELQAAVPLLIHLDI